jgi:Hom_end-associated Hint
VPSVHTRVLIDIATLQVIERDSYSYDGPWELCKGGNSQSEMTQANTLSQQQLQIMQNQLSMQQSQLGMVNPSLQAIISNGGMLPAQEAAMRSAALNQIGAGETQAIGSINQDLVARGITGGANAGSGGIARDFGGLQAALQGQTASALQNVQMAKGQGLQSAIGMGLGEGGMFGSQALGFGGQGVNALGIGQQAAAQADQSQTGFFGSLIGGLAGLGGSVATAACPAFGSLILMADGTEKAVELLVIGDQIMGIDDEPCTVEDLPSDRTATIRVTFDDGHVTRNSPTHAFALPRGGFTVSAKSLGRQILTDKGASYVTNIERAGTALVFNIITDGSHTYRADGVWALGVGDAERYIPMAEWAKIGAALNG